MINSRFFSSTSQRAVSLGFCLLGVILLLAPVSQGYTLELYTPESQSHADNGYYLHWRDGDPMGYTLNLYAVSGSQMDILINPTPINAGLSGFEGNEYFWDTSAIPEGMYRIRMNLLNFGGQIVASTISENQLSIAHADWSESQEIYVYPFIHLKNSFLMGSEMNSLYEILDVLDETNFKEFEFTFNWPIAYYIENGLWNDADNSGYIYEPDEDLIEALIDYADNGGAIGAYEPLAGWHYNNIFWAYTGEHTNWFDLGELAIQYETTFQNQITGEFPTSFAPGAKYYLDQLFGRKTIELGSNQPLPNFHVTRLLDNHVVCQWQPQQISSDDLYREINGKDYYDNGCMFWYLGQLMFSHTTPEVQINPEDKAFDRQIPLFSNLYYKKNGQPVDSIGFQSFQENVDNALTSILDNGIQKDIFYIFEHSISLENTDDWSFNYYNKLYQQTFGITYGNWTYSRLARMNCREELNQDATGFPDNNVEYCFKDDPPGTIPGVSYKTSDEYLELRCNVFKDSFEYINHLKTKLPNLHILTGDDMYDMVRKQADQSISAADLNRIASYITDNLYQDSRLPAYIRLENLGPCGELLSVEYFHLAEAYKMLADALTVQSIRGQLPLEVISKNTLGPVELEDDLPDLQTTSRFTINDIVTAASVLDLSDPLTNPALWPSCITPAESYIVQSTNYIGTQEVNCAEMLYLMAETYQYLYTGNQGMIIAKPLYTLNEWAYLIETIDGNYNSNANPAVYTPALTPETPAPEPMYFNFIQLWTFKPAQIVNPL